jgi:signal transduction histidine kinase
MTTWPAEYDETAADLYDDVVRDVYSAGLIIYGVAAGLGAGPASDRLQAATAALDEAIERIRLAVLALDDRPITTGSAPAVPPVTRHAGDLPEDLVDDLLAVVREALAIVYRRAHARAVEVALTVADGSVALRVTDDSLEPAEVAGDGCLEDLRRRSRAHGGLLVAEPGTGGGTQLTWAVPLR